MPRPKKIVQEETKISETVEVQEELVVEEIADVIIAEPVEQIIEEPAVLSFTDMPTTLFKVYHLGNFVEDVEENSDKLNNYLESNKNQLLSNIEKLRATTNDQEDLVLFNVPATDNRKYNSLAQYFQQNGLAPQNPKISDWMTYYKIKYPLATEEEIAIQVFGPLDYSFEIA